MSAVTTQEPTSISVQVVEPTLVPVQVVEPTAVPVARIGERGPQGPPAEALVVTATQSITSGTLVALVGTTTEKYDVTNPGHAFALAGIATNGANTGEPLTIQVIGKAVIPGWGLTAGQIYQAGENGQLATGPTVGAVFAQVVGLALSESTLLINQQNILIL